MIQFPRPHTTTRFARAVVKLKVPSSQGYVQADWDAAYEASDKLVSDERLYEASRWIGEEAAALRSSYSNPELDALSPAWNTIVAIAAINREYRTAVDLSLAQIRSSHTKGTLSADSLANLRIETALGQRFTVAELAETAVDAAENWLFDAATGLGTEEPGTADIAAPAIMAIQSYTLRKSLNLLWNDAWFEGWHIEEGNDGEVRWVAGNPERERLMKAWRSRQEANFLNYPNIDRTVWPTLPPAGRRKNGRKSTVTKIREGRFGDRFRTGPVSYLSKDLPQYVIEKGMLQGSYVADFLEAKMPTDERLNVLLLQDAWHVILDISKLLARRAPLPTSLSGAEAHRLALPVKRADLQAALEKALNLKDDLPSELIDFLTFSPQTGGKSKAKGNKGLWAAPLVPLPGKDEFLLPLPVLATSNPARRAEAWLEKGGIDDSRPNASRGDRYEELFRESVSTAIAGNRLFSSAASAPKGIPITKGFQEQIDLLVSFGDLCVVGDVKFFLMPADAHERERYDDKLTKAANQVNRKVAALETRRDVVAAALGIGKAQAAKLRLLPLVLTNQGYGFSSRVDGVLIAEAQFFRRFVGNGTLITGKALDLSTGRYIDQETTFYSSEAMAAQDFETIFEAPYPLTRFLDRVRWRETVLPALVHPPLIIQVPVLEDLTGLERLQAESMIAAFG